MICQKGNTGNVNPAAFYKVKANEPTYILGSRVLPNELYCVSDILTSFTKDHHRQPRGLAWLRGRCAMKYYKAVHYNGAEAFWANKEVKISL